MGPLGVPEMMFIMVLALVLFGPKKLPEIGRTVGKAISEFRRASTELKSTFEREMQSIEQETNEIKTIASQYQYDTYNYDYSSAEGPHEGSYGTESHDSTAVIPAITSASAPEGAESPSAVAPEGTVARGAETASVSEPAVSFHGVPEEPADSRDALRADLSAFQPVHTEHHDTPVSPTPEHNT
jgi:TatA/E family protein of Tat protein translocase